MSLLYVKSTDSIDNFCVNTHFSLMAEKQLTRQQFLWYAWRGLLSKYNALHI